VARWLPRSAEGLNELAWRLGTGLPGERDPKKGLELIRNAIAVAGDESHYLNTLGAALYRNGLWTEAAAMQRVTEDLEMAHPLLAAEWATIQREMRMGLSAAEAIKRFGERCELEDVRDLAAVLQQSERFGVGVANALRLHADACRLDRQQRAEEAAQKAGVKILFPTLLCIFPAVFIVLVGPAAYQVAGLLAKTR